MCFSPQIKVSGTKQRPCKVSSVSRPARFQNLEVNLVREFGDRGLKPGGIIRIATPDLRFLLGLYQDPERPLHKAYIAYSAQRGGLPATAVFVINRFHTAWGHKIIYDRETLT